MCSDMFIHQHSQVAVLFDLLNDDSTQLKSYWWDVRLSVAITDWQIYFSTLFTIHLDLHQAMHGYTCTEVQNSCNY